MDLIHLRSSAPVQTPEMGVGWARTSQLYGGTGPGSGAPGAGFGKLSQGQRKGPGFGVSSLGFLLSLQWLEVGR